MSLPQDTLHEVTRSFTAPPLGWKASPSQDTQHDVTRSIITSPGWDSKTGATFLNQSEAKLKPGIPMLGTGYMYWL